MKTGKNVPIYDENLEKFWGIWGIKYHLSYHVPLTSRARGAFCQVADEALVIVAPTFGFGHDC